MTAGGTPDNPGLLNWAQLLILSVFWGTAFMSMAVALEGYGSLTVAAGRTAIAALALLTVGAALDQGPRRIAGRRALAFAVILGIVNLAVPFSLLTWGLQHVPSAFAGIAMGAAPIFVLPLAAIFSPEENIGPRKAAGILLGFVGLVVLIAPGIEGGRETGLELAGGLACIAASLCYSIGSVLTRRAPAMPPVALTGVMFVTATAVLAPLALGIDGWPSLDAPPRATAALMFAGLVPTALAFFLRVRIIRSAGSVFMSLVAYLVPLWAVLFGLTLMDEALNPSDFAALALILAGIALGQWRGIAAMLRRGRA